MKFLEIIRYILYLHHVAGLGHKEIRATLEDCGLTVPWFHIFDVIEMLHDHPPAVDGGHIYNIDWAMGGFRVIMEDFPTAEMSQEVSDRLKELDLGYNWDVELIRGVILAHDQWMQSDNWLVE